MPAPIDQGTHKSVFPISPQASLRSRDCAEKIYPKMLAHHWDAVQAAQGSGGSELGMGSSGALCVP